MRTETERNEQMFVWTGIKKFILLAKLTIFCTFVSVSISIFTCFFKWFPMGLQLLLSGNTFGSTLIYPFSHCCKIGNGKRSESKLNALYTIYTPMSQREKENKANNKEHKLQSKQIFFLGFKCLLRKFVVCVTARWFNCFCRKENGILSKHPNSESAGVFARVACHFYLVR